MPEMCDPQQYEDFAGDVPLDASESFVSVRVV